MTCIDCQLEHAVTITQYARVHDGSLRHWHICHACAQAFEERKNEAVREWHESEAALKAALARIPFGQANPTSVRKQRRSA